MNGTESVQTGESLDYTEQVAKLVPSRRYDYSFDTALDKKCLIHIKEADIGSGGSVGILPVQIITSFRITMNVIQEEYTINQRDCYATLIVLGLAIVENRYKPELNRVKSVMRNDFFSGTKKEDLDKRYDYCEHFFKKRSNGMGGRKQLNVYGDKHRVLAPIIQNSEYFNLSRSDMVHVLLSHALVLWNRLPQDYREEYESINRDFELHTRSFYNVESLDITSKVGQPIGQ